ncbi:sensor domain-containing diguanylate cyclase [Oxalicibacterium faecigallinarum]|uniref:sensor domain-containing diguanylate cyclase n=1 Tax=Oxalicibacterium faecigallinarum TaxID=573741 RepID=UPI00280B982E|nr:sensor domain-containing diguanylate cyclase [Oxalicibacterium faecigallinarum]
MHISLEPDKPGANMVHDFSSATKETLQFLHATFGFDLWMVTRTEGNNWIVLDVKNTHYGTRPGAVFNWTDSLCSRMVRGEGPRIAPRASDVQIYREAPIASQLKIGAYVGVPLKRADGSLFGTLCAIDPEPQSDDIYHAQKYIELLADLLSSLLHTELALADSIRRAERAEIDAARDSLTSLYNRRGWDQLLEREEDRSRRYGNPAGIVMIDLDDLKTVNDTQGHDAGDKLIKRAATTIQRVTRQNDVVARIGGDEFAILAIECSADDTEILVKRVRAGLQAAGVKASIGHASRHPENGLLATAREADMRMYAEKRQRHLERATHS